MFSFILFGIAAAKVVTDNGCTFDCTVDGLYCINDTKYSKQYFECSNTFQGLRPCAPGTECIAKERVDFGYNPCGYKEETTKSEEKSKETSKVPVTPSVDKSEEKEICKEDGFYCTGDEKHTKEYYICSPTYNGYSKCPAGTKCGAKGHYPYTVNPCILDEELIEKSKEKSEIKSTDKGEIPDCKENGFYCVEDGKHDFQYYVCADSYKGFMKCPTGTKCAGASTKPYTLSPCVLLNDNSIENPQKSTEKSVGTPSVDKNEDIPTCTEEGLYCVLDGKHDNEYYICTDAYKGFSKCPPGTICKGKGKFDIKVDPCVEKTTESSKAKSVEKPVVSEENELKCKEDGLFCVIDGKHNDQYFQCSEFYTGFRPCSKGTWCKGEQEKPYDTDPCVWYDETTWGKKI
ncbi:Cyst wall-specific glycoprotein Jacob family protein [Entamoeba invadens IP1]|uniref:Cyst wall-specific glycoprotein Jacob family protein n=1 Tax=Entamoeba invadens IP1 TaxID=370355 RepID=UPI0002C3F3FC|nr:Cyst wall-specific glycoprotein Jacob family protein [Entamoeba invadens IP1]ELP85101.1 Cyst wall-specific glycoprotein Jacob family protein [Entamoeba invadens IP1]|eukprot:XP_004184447.1 Cyst wall-specific glycoprotein Jacob family protein [Entamoeba invadens IP1]